MTCVWLVFGQTSLASSYFYLFQTCASSKVKLIRLVASVGEWSDDVFTRGVMFVDRYKMHRPRCDCIRCTENSGKSRWKLGWKRNQLMLLLVGVMVAITSRRLLVTNYALTWHLLICVNVFCELVSGKNQTREYVTTLCVVSTLNFHCLHFAWVVDDAKCIVVTRVCVSVCLCLSVCPRPYAHTTARTRM